MQLLIWDMQGNYFNIPLRDNKINSFNLVTTQQQGINVFLHVILVNYLHIYGFDPVTINTVSFCKTKLSWSIFSFTNNYCQVYIFIWDTYHLLHDLIYIDLTLLPWILYLSVKHLKYLLLQQQLLPNLG